MAETKIARGQKNGKLDLRDPDLGRHNRASSLRVRRLASEMNSGATGPGFGSPVSSLDSARCRLHAESSEFRRRFRRSDRRRGDQPRAATARTQHTQRRNEKAKTIDPQITQICRVHLSNRFDRNDRRSRIQKSV
jgi:hypothetical protein